MTILNKIIAIGVSCSLALSARAQQFPLLNHYTYNPYLYNPARAGQNDYGTAAIHFKKQWTSLPASPFSGIIAMESPLKTPKLGNMGLGGMLYVDQAHLSTNIGGLGSYAYHIPFGDGSQFKHGLSAGLSIGFVHQRFNYPDAIVDNPDDNRLIPAEGVGTTFDFSAGLDYQWRTLHIGISMLQGLNIGLNPALTNTQNIQYVNTRQWLGMASYQHFFGKEGEKPRRIYLKPIVLARIIEDVPVQLEGNLLVGLEGIGWLGVGYRSSNNAISTSSIDITIGVEIKQNFVFAYTFSPNFGAAIQNSMGMQHEMSLMYRFGKNKEVEHLKKTVTLLQEENKTLNSTLAETRTHTDSITRMIGSTQERLNKQEGQLNEQKQTIQQQQAQIDQNKAEIDALRKAIENRPLEFKKVGEVFFDLGKETLSESSKANLDAVEQALRQAKNNGNGIQVYVKGNASTDGDPQKNMALSMKRAAAVRQYLIAKGLDGNNITIVPMGETDPVKGDASSSKGNAADRRVDIIFTEQKRKGRL